MDRAELLAILDMQRDQAARHMNLAKIASDDAAFAREAERAAILYQSIAADLNDLSLDAEGNRHMASDGYRRTVLPTCGNHTANTGTRRAA